MLFRRKIDRSCTYCRFAGRVDAEHMVCQKYGVVPATHQCRKFRYDPLKRVPARPQPQDFSKYGEKDFSL